MFEGNYCRIDRDLTAHDKGEAERLGAELLENLEAHGWKACIEKRPR